MKGVAVVIDRWAKGCLLAAVLLVQTAAAAQQGIDGTWLTEDGTSKVQISADADVVNGRLVWLKDATSSGSTPLDAHNPDPALRKRPLLGTLVLRGFKAGAAGTWNGGSVYAPRSGKSYPAELSLQGDGRLRLKVDAGMVFRTEYWTR